MKKRCSRCKREKSLDSFYGCRDTRDRKHSCCKECAKEKSLQHHRVNREDRLIANRNAAKKQGRGKYFRDYRSKCPDKIMARRAVQMATRRNDLPTASGLVCEYCQEAQAQQYHHHEGYAPEHVLDVVALCMECHGKENG